jgi:hypothetical protein
VRGLLAEGWSFLGAGRSREAGLAFGRILLQDPANSEARRGLDLARSATAESRRDQEARLDEARGAFEAGEWDRSRALLERILTGGGEPESAHDLLDRLDRREGRIAAPSDSERPVSVAPPVAPLRPAWSRKVLVGAWSLAFASLAAGVAGSWDRIVGGLVEPPLPVSGPPAPPVTEIAAPTTGELTLAQAKRLLEQGDPVGAMVILDRVLPDDPAYPFAERLLLEARAALGRGPRP